MTPNQLEQLEYLINDPDWDVSQRNDAWELLQAMRARVRELEARLQKRDGELFDCQSKSEGGYDILKECAEVLEYCRPYEPSIMGNDDWALGQIRKQDERRQRYEKLRRSLNAATSLPTPALDAARDLLKSWREVLDQSDGELFSARMLKVCADQLEKSLGPSAAGVGREKGE